MRFRKKHELKKSIYILTGDIKRNSKSTSNTLKKAEHVAVIIAAIALITQSGFSIMQYYQWRSETEARQEERIFRAWQIITSGSPGNGGLVQAIEFLARNNVSLKSIDISCQTHGGDWRVSENEKLCAYGRPNLNNLNLSEENIGRQVDLTEANFNGADLRDSNFTGANLWRASFDNADLAGAVFDRAILHDVSFHSMFSSFSSENQEIGPDFRGASLGYTKFTNAMLQYSKFDGELSLGRFDKANIGGVDFSEATLAKFPEGSILKMFEKFDNSTYEQIFETSWIYIWDKPPKFPTSDKVNPELFLNYCDFISNPNDINSISEDIEMDCRLKSDWPDVKFKFTYKKQK